MALDRKSHTSLLESAMDAVTEKKPEKKLVAEEVKETEVAEVGEVEEFDLIDEILAEGIELYGEEGMTIILNHFAETGEISEELADLLG